MVVLLSPVMPGFENTLSSGTLLIKAFSFGHEREHILQRYFQLVPADFNLIFSMKNLPNNGQKEKIKGLV